MPSSRERVTPFFIVVLSGCQFVSGLDELDSGSGGSAAGPGSTSASTGATQATTGAGACPVLAAGSCVQGPMTCEGMCEVDQTCKVGCPGAGICGGVMMMTDDVVCQDPMQGTTNCFFECRPNGTENCSDKTILCPANAPRCEVSCEGLGACSDTRVVCGEGECRVTCGPGACSANTVVTCGHGRCDVTCSGGDVGNPTIDATSGPCELLQATCL